MRCHYCDRTADLSVERNGVTVHLCTTHFRHRLADLADDGWPSGLTDELES